MLKDPLAPWESKKMRSQMKLKNEFEITLKVVDWIPHKNHPAWVGSLLVESLPSNVGDDVKVLKTAVGSGLNEEDGSELDRRLGGVGFIGKMVEVKAECITKNDALQHPRIIEIRHDKKWPDTYLDVLGAYNDSIGAKI